MKMRKNYKVCPRCGNKCMPNQDKCEECNLIFSRLQFASNKSAKKKIRKFDTDFVIYTTQYPSDVSRIKLVLYCIFLGLFGGHYYYVGKYIKGGLMTASFVYLLFCTIFNPIMAQYEFAFFPIGVYASAWIVSLVLVLTKKFKVPVIVEVPQETVQYSREDIEKAREEIKAESKKLKNQNKNLEEVVVDNIQNEEKLKNEGEK